MIFAEQENVKRSAIGIRNTGEREVDGDLRNRSKHLYSMCVCLKQFISTHCRTNRMSRMVLIPVAILVGVYLVSQVYRGE